MLRIFRSFRDMDFEKLMDVYQQSNLENAKAAAHKLGVGTGIDPFMTLSFMALPVIPAVRLTTRGVVDVNTQQFI